ncbi:MAG: hypothetical protein MZV63_55530 [Marinilabiliales bacterium]|nr:hypothetical protein [Marinilabiliales bacterium]
MLNNWEEVRCDSNRTCRVLTSSFLTPLIWNLAGGFSFRLPKPVRSCWASPVAG